MLRREHKNSIFQTRKKTEKKLFMIVFCAIVKGEARTRLRSARTEAVGKGKRVWWLWSDYGK